MGEGDFGPYVLPLLVLYGLFSFVPALVAAARQATSLPSIVLLNAASPLGVILLMVNAASFPGMATAGTFAILLVILGGVVLWISTMIDAVVD